MNEFNGSAGDRCLTGLVYAIPIAQVLLLTKLFGFSLLFAERWLPALGPDSRWTLNLAFAVTFLIQLGLGWMAIAPRFHRFLRFNGLLSSLLSACLVVALAANEVVVRPIADSLRGFILVETVHYTISFAALAVAIGASIQAVRGRYPQIPLLSAAIERQLP